MDKSIFDRLEERLRQQGTSFTVLRHEPVFTSEEAARVRGTPLASGAKALIVKAQDRFVMLVMPADRKLASRLARGVLGVKNIRFATPEEVQGLTGLTPGSIPPFGSLFALPTYCDPALGASSPINFNAGDHSVSIQMTFADYEATEKPVLAAISEGR